MTMTTREPHTSSLKLVPKSGNATEAARVAYGVSIHAPARLHLGFIDLSGARGRRYGSVGLTIDDLHTHVDARLATSTQVQGPQSDINVRAERYLAMLAAMDKIISPVQLHVLQHAPAHAGFGSGTQLALTVALAVKELFGINDKLSALARILERGARSGVGIGAFEQGGFLIDGGHALAANASNGARLEHEEAAPPLLARADFPADWRVLLILDPHHRGLHGQAEKEAFSALPPFPRASAERLSHAVLMQALPALAEHELKPFGEAITELQQVVGDYFAPAQGGRYASAEVTKVLHELAQAGVAGYGQSSWGPTGFAMFASAEEAEQWSAALSNRHADLQFKVVKGCNHGATVSRHPLVHPTHREALHAV